MRGPEPGVTLAGVDRPDRLGADEGRTRDLRVLNGERTRLGVNEGK